MQSQDTIDYIKKMIKEYSALQKERQLREIPPNPFQQISTRIQFQKGTMSKEEIIYSYIEEMKKDLVKNLEKNKVKSDVFMASASDNQFSYLAGESQDPYEDEPTFEYIF